jgi:nucleoid DNA-binding protein
MPTITKKQLADSIALELGLTQMETKKVIEAFLEKLKQHLSSADRIELRDFGVFSVKERKSRLGRNPNKPQEVVTIPQRRVVHFKVGREWKKRVDSKPTV